MNPLSTRVANTPLPLHSKSAVKVSTGASDPGSPAAVGRPQHGCGGLANRLVCVGSGQDRARANSAVSVIGTILASISKAFQAIVLSPRS